MLNFAEKIVFKNNVDMDVITLFKFEDLINLEGTKLPKMETQTP